MTLWLDVISGFIRDKLIIAFFWIITKRVVAIFTDVSGQPIVPVLRVQDLEP